MSDEGRREAQAQRSVARRFADAGQAFADAAALASLDRCAWPRKGGGICDTPCVGRFCDKHAKIDAVRQATAALRLAQHRVAWFRERVIDAATEWARLDCDTDDRLRKAVAALMKAREAEHQAAMARVRLMDQQKRRRGAR